MTISTDLSISNSMSSFVPKYWLNWQILWLFLMNFVDKDGTSKVYLPVHPWMSNHMKIITFVANIQSVFPKWFLPQVELLDFGNWDVHLLIWGLKYGTGEII